MRRPLVAALLVSAAAFVCFVTVTALPAKADRQALVIGIDRYEALPRLRNAVADARAVAAALTERGFRTSLHADLGRRDMSRKLAEFVGRIRPGDTVLVYFSGHGVALGPENLLLPRDMPKVAAAEEGVVRDEGTSVDEMIRRLRSKGAANVIAVIDACRDNPFERGATRGIGAKRGLGRLEAPRGVFVLFSAGIGEQALDRLSDADPEANSVFTRRLVPLLQVPGITQVQLAKRLQREVSELAATVNHRQLPAFYDQIVGEITIDGSTPRDTAARTEAPVATIRPTNVTTAATNPAPWSTRIATNAEPTTRRPRDDAAINRPPPPNAATGDPTALDGVALVDLVRERRLPLTPASAGLLSRYTATRRARIEAARKAQTALGKGYDTGARRMLEAVLAGDPIGLKPRALAGKWRCRSTQFSGEGIFSYDYFRCEVVYVGGMLHFRKTTGSQRKLGKLYPLDERTALYLGTWETDYDRAKPYGVDPKKDEAGYLFRTGDLRLRLEIVRTDQLEFLELVK